MIKVVFFSLMLSSCAELHHVQIGEFDGTKGNLVPFSVKVSEIGVNLKEASQIASSLTKSTQASKDIEGVNDVIAMFQMGPVTGNKVFNDTYAEGLIHLILQECPSGKVTGLMSIRETRKYPVISGEIIKVTGFCIT